ncbi:glycosyltransferase family 2 protein [Halalkalibacterium halodurans]|uniref:Glycosyl transferase n=1 Tax=Halalkalibacterium halodurans TaxID=86665 RepID=A0A0M0KFW0_ALKHA|nr:glycosyltransferase family 2 protein [Halalkalibacterium halodurans]MED3646437.1 glycosyltransferase family 2 protein [Halalkalibacterium halodurans]MED4163952.1 glycosyltransferase family 2 protein [Halalkalibacterium halodurans]TES56760.1 glycosyltransferase family 2 protein [Halalkalibacterium halodurans]TPE68187.1 glycosyltransferase family 2 protein [Halalkalibacterium halodurans]
MERINVDGPVVSIITPCYNAEMFIRDTIESVLNQTFSNWEMVIVDDGSTDRTVQIVESYASQDERIRLIQLEKNSGPAVSRNTAIQHARGRYLAFLDSDDQWLPEKLERQLEFMQKRNVAFSFTSYKTMTEDGSETGKVVNVPENVDYHELLKQNVIGCLTVMLDQEKTGHVQMVNMRSRQDYALWLHLCKRGFIAYGLQDVLAKYRVVHNSVSHNKWKMAKQNWRLYRENEKLSFVKSGWYFMHYVWRSLKKYLSK